MDTRDDFSSSTPVLYVNADGLLLPKEKLPPFSDSQSTVCYDADTVILSSTSVSNASQKSIIEIKSNENDKDDFQFDQLRCSLALLRVIFWNAEKFGPPDSDKLKVLQALLLEKVKKYDI